MKFFERWWWPAFIPVFALWTLPIPGFSDGGFQAKPFVAIVWLAVGLLLELAAHKELRLQDASKILLILRRHPPVLIALLYTLWVLIAAFASDLPAIALTGSLSDSSDGAFWNLALITIFILVYIRCVNDYSMRDRMTYSFLLTCLLLCFLGFLEFFLRRGFFYQNIQTADLPVTSFFGKGHFMGIMAIATAIALTLWFKSSKWLIIVIALFAALLGLSGHRAPWISVIPVFVLGYLFKRHVAYAFIILLVFFISLYVGNQIKVISSAGATRSLTSETSLFTRSYLWKAAIGGIIARPLTGFGGGQFQGHFYKYLSEKDLKALFKLELGLTFRSVIGKNTVSPLFAIFDRQGKKNVMSLSAIKVHNQFLDIAVLWGIPGLLLYIFLAVYGARGLLILDPLAVGFLVYQFFLITWFIPIDAEGLIFALWGAAAAVKCPNLL